MPYILLVLAVLFWSGNFVIGRGIHETVPPISLSFWRWVVALIIMLPFVVKPMVRQRDLLRRNWRILSLLAVLGVTNFSSFLYIALQTNTVINTVLINSLMPVLIVFITWIGFQDRLTYTQGFGGLISFIGLIWIITRGAPTVLLTIELSRGDLWTLAATGSWALYSALLRKRPKNMHSMCFLGFITGVGLLFLSPFYVWEVTHGATFVWTPATAAAVVYISLFASILAFIFWNRAIEIIGANRGGIFVHLMPVFSIVMAIIFLGERLQMYHLPGMAGIILGIVLTTIGKPGDQKTTGRPLPEKTK